ncbi:MAG: hypothetical protein ACRD8O_18560 [Bryobacteraceae bacterium]
MNATENRRGARAGVLSPIFLIVAVAWAQSDVIKPRASSAEYPAQARAHGVSIGAAVAAPYRDLIVIEVAVYPPPTGSVNVTLNDFALRLNNGELVIKPAAPPDVARGTMLDKGQITQPTAGYLYFSVPIPKDRRSSAELQYFGATKILRIPLPDV